MFPVASLGSNSNSMVTFSPTVMFLISLMDIVEGSLDTSKVPLPACSTFLVPFTSRYIASMEYSPAGNLSKVRFARVMFICELKYSLNVAFCSAIIFLSES